MEDIRVKMEVKVEKPVSHMCVRLRGPGVRPGTNNRPPSSSCHRSGITGLLPVPDMVRNGHKNRSEEETGGPGVNEERGVGNSYVGSVCVCESGEKRMSAFPTRRVSPTAWHTDTLPPIPTSLPLLSPSSTQPSRAIPSPLPLSFQSRIHDHS